VGHLCNLATEFNGLVSKGVNRKIGPFYIKRMALENNTIFSFVFSPSINNPSFIFRTTDRYYTYIFKVFNSTVADSLILVHE